MHGFGALGFLEDTVLPPLLPPLIRDRWLFIPDSLITVWDSIDSVSVSLDSSADVSVSVDELPEMSVLDDVSVEE